jgi:hypothetical protein
VKGGVTFRGDKRSRILPPCRQISALNALLFDLLEIQRNPHTIHQDGTSAY